MAAAARPFDGYPTSFGNQRASIRAHAGPASYTQTAPVVGTVPTPGGDSVSAVEFGTKLLDYVSDGVTDDGIFSVTSFPLAASNVGPGIGASKTTYGLRWVSRVTAAAGGQNQTAGSEAVAATNLSTFVVRLFALGPK